MPQSGTLRQYIRHLTDPKVNNHLIKLKDYNVCLQLKIPDYQVQSDTVELNVEKRKSQETKHLFKALRAHLDFHVAIFPKGDKHDGASLKRSLASVNTISLFFPDIRHEGIKVCMAVWLETLCTVDDQIENMSLEDAGEAIEEAIAVLKDERLLQEIHLKNGTLSQTLDAYLAIRRKTIGLKPAFALIRSAYNQPYPPSKETTQLQNDVAIVAGLQNDLIGLEKDIRTGEVVNAVVFLLGGMEMKRSGKWTVGSGDLRATTGEACRLHDLYLERVLKRVERLGARARGVPGMEVEAALASVEASLMQTHFEWCTSAKRYQSKTA
ncbi:terpene synthase family protein [Aspergillus affinis]|uniref:terpene synthase family protein n=1 Tax=Aspergillus affinis TaxID=1070780 RepID=UPI0022FF2EE7|nr:isoprenoid synthase domain-containing protein [Aspergillus affinis]KAI9042794.1 isoprenoid synthase domain-containing protein [Aspergillus affinis]